MKIGKRYIVTKGNDTFETGDRISLNTDGSINCYKEWGWLDAEDVEEALVGMECELDTEWIEARKKKLQQLLDDLQ